jgi:hypothetical protein
MQPERVIIPSQLASSSRGRTTSWSRCLVTVVVFIASLCPGCRRSVRHGGAISASLCELRERPQDFGGRVVQTSGWVYTDLESFGLQDNGRCGVELEYSETMEQRRKTEAVVQQFEARVADAKHGSFDTQGQVFVVVRGTFAKDMHPRGIPVAGTLLVDQIECSSTTAIETTPEAEALSRCQQQN